MEFEEEPRQDKPARELPLNHKEKTFLKLKIAKLQNKGVLTEVDHVPGECISNLVLRPKKDKAYFRMILNLVELNTFATNAILKWIRLKRDFA